MITTDIQPTKQHYFVSVLLDISALALIYFVPALSHLLSVPLYLIEPMRLMLVLVMVHTNRNNAYLIALTLPVFSFLVSGHPVLLKMVLMSAELVLNVFVFYFLLNRTKRIFPSILLSIIISKMAYYGLKYLLILMGLLQMELVSTSLLIQAGTTLMFTAYVWKFFPSEPA